MKKKLIWTNILALVLVVVLAFVTVNAIDSGDGTTSASTGNSQTEIIDSDQISEDDIKPDEPNDKVYTADDYYVAWAYAMDILNEGMGYKMSSTQQATIKVGPISQVQNFGTSRVRYTNGDVYNYAESHGAKDTFEQVYQDSTMKQVYMREGSKANTYGATQKYGYSAFVAKKGSLPGEFPLLVNMDTITSHEFSIKYLKKTDANGGSSFEKVYQYKISLNPDTSCEDYKTTILAGAADYSDGTRPVVTRASVTYTINTSGYFETIKYELNYKMGGQVAGVVKGTADVDFWSIETYNQDYMNVYIANNRPEWLV